MGLDEKISNQVTGFLLLLLFLSMLFSTRMLTLRSDPGDDPAPCPEPLFVQVEGDVQNPGVYSFCSTPTFQDLIGKAGGLKRGEASFPAPSAPIISSGSKVVFTTDGRNFQIVQSQMSAFHKVTLGLRVSLNAESEEGLTAVPGIGPNLAKRIVEERARRGGFRDLEELQSIPGIGLKTFARMRPLLVI